jgi:hypothetical protein
VQASHPSGAVVRLTGYAPDERQPQVPDESEDHWRLWMEHGGRMRSESSVGSEPLTVVFDGPAWWSWSPHAGGMTNSGVTNHGHGFGPAETLVDAAALLSALRLQFLGTDTLLGRDVFRIRGLPRARTSYQPDYGLHELGVGADEYILSVDSERGLLLCSCSAACHRQRLAAVGPVRVARPFGGRSHCSLAIDDHLPSRQRVPSSDLQDPTSKKSPQRT